MNFFSNRAFAAFTVALAASMWALFTDIGRPYLPSVPILVYSLYLYANRSSVGQLGGDALKDSPYFLGFLLTMFALFKIFNDVATNSSLFGQNPALMTQEVGGAVLTTIVGLFCRQALLALVQDDEPEEDDRLAALANAVTSHAVAFEVARQQFFREMAEERERQSAEWNATQERMLARLENAEQARARSTVSPAAPGAFTAVPITPTAPVPTFVPQDASPSVAPSTSASPAETESARSMPGPSSVASARDATLRDSVSRAGASPVATATDVFRDTPPDAFEAIEPTVRTPTPFEPPRTPPYAGPPVESSAPRSTARNSPVGSVPAVGPGGLPPGSSGATRPYPPYLGQGRASDAPRDEG